MNPTSAESEVLATSVQPEAWVLNALDRCDACGSQAYVRVRVSTGELYFCAHHFNGNEVRLREVSSDILDEREKLVKS